jgi:hypothetical protein
VRRLKDIQLTVSGVVFDGRHVLVFGIGLILSIGISASFIVSALNSDAKQYEPYQDNVKLLSSFSGYSRSERGSENTIYLEGKGLVEKSEKTESMGYSSSGSSTGDMSSINLVKMGNGSSFDWGGGSNYSNATE